MRSSKAKVFGLLLISALLVVSIAFAAGFDVCELPGESQYVPPPEVSGEGASKATYNGQLKIFIVEPISRWKDNNGNDYHYGFLDFAYDAPFTLLDGDSLSVSYSWDATAAGYGNVNSSNLRAIAVIYDMSHGWEAHSCTTGASCYPFTAYYSDAAAAASVSEQWPNVVNENYSHTTFAEKGTASWCGPCVTMNANMHIVDEYYDYPFMYAAMIVDLNGTASARMSGHFNLHWVPSTYFDCGYRIFVGAAGIGNIISAIDYCGNRAVPSFGLIIDMNEAGKGVYDGSVSLRVNSPPDVPAEPTGIIEGATDIPYEYTCTAAIDPENDPLSYVFEFDTALQESEVTPGDPVVAYTWPEAGTFEVKAIAKDKFGFESDWSTPLSVVIHDYVAGDANGDNVVNIFDVTHVISFLYLSGPDPIPLDAGDANGSGIINIFDVTYLIAFLYLDGPSPLYPSM